jgi:hypothetical protein
MNIKKENNGRGIQAMLKFVLTVVVFVAMLVPTWLYLLVRFLLSPEGFWQNMIVLSIGVYLLGAIQLILLVVGCLLIVGIIQS